MWKSLKNVFLYVGTEDSPKEEQKALLIAVHSNLALCYLKLKEHFDAKNSATSALELDPKNEKALFRRGQALLALGEAELAVKDFTEVLNLDPNNKAAQSQLATCQQTIREQLKKEKKIYANMFEKFAKTDTQVNAN